jgi:hypothetical protein
LVLIAVPLVLYGAWKLVGTATAPQRERAKALAVPAAPGPDDSRREELKPVATGAETVLAPGLDQRRYIAPLEDAYRRIDPSQDGWQTEAFSEAVAEPLERLSRLLEGRGAIEQQQLRELAADDFVCQPLRPESLRDVFRDGSLLVQRGDDSAAEDTGLATSVFRGPVGLGAAARHFRGLFAGGRLDHVKLKLFTVEPREEQVTTRVYFQAVGDGGPGALQVNATWKLRWHEPPSGPPRLTSIEVEKYETVLHQGGNRFMFADCTEAILGQNACYREQFLYPTDYWRARIPRELGLDVVANHGLAVGDVNGDQLDDLYVCQQGGLPNRLLVQNPDGSLRDVSSESGADWLDTCASALLVDLDNDGNRDLAVAQEWRILLMSNDGKGRFQLEFGTSSKAQSFSLAAADYDLDGDLDVYVCGYNPTVSTLRRGVMGEPMPFHDANNGGQNMLLRNDGNWLFNDVTAEVGLDQNNTRFSFAAAWEDYDNDGDADLYVANDYGRNNLYRNDHGRFVDVAEQLGVEDISSGMSVCWADYNRDGRMDLYTSNMFSAAGNRITYQRQFQPAASAAVRRQFQRLARGNTLFANAGGEGFRDVSDDAGVTMGRWAWGSRFVDLNGDGWEDLVVANGFVSTEDTGDL